MQDIKTEKTYKLRWKMVKIVNKKGMSHVEMILSFLIFISFVIFLLIFFNPIKKISGNTSALDMTEKRILEYVSSNFSVSSLKLNSSFIANSGDCFYFNFSLPDTIIIKDENGGIIGAINYNGYIYFNYTYTEKKFYKIYSSEELEENTIGTECQELDKSNYTLGLTNFYKKVSSSMLTELNDKYKADYENLKKTLGLKNDFNIIVKDSSGTIIFKAEKFKPKATEVMAKDKPIEILNKDATIISAIMNIQVWD